MVTTCTTITPTLPRKATHGKEVCDRYGNRWKYDAGQDSWISEGTISVPTVVTEEVNGLVSSDIFEKLRKLKAFVDTGFDLSTLKIAPGRDAYWYYFRSSDKCFRFRPEGDSTLRIEIDRGRIYQILLKEVCPGVRGPKGDQGAQGDAGIPGADETCFTPSSVSGNKLDFAIYTPTPLLDSSTVTLPNDHVPEISVRLFPVTLPAAASATKTGSQLQHLGIVLQSSRPEILRQFQTTRESLQQRSLGLVAQASNLCNIALSPVAHYDAAATIADTPSVIIEVSPDQSTDTTVTSTLSLNESQTLTSIQFDPETNIVCGSIYLADGSWADLADEWCLKSRQKGPDGEQGDPGECYLKVVECTIDDTNIVANCPIINARLDCDLGVLYTLCADLIEEVCAEKVSLLVDSPSLANTGALKSTFAAVQMVIDDCKYIHRYEVSLEADELPELELLHWEPQPGCLTRRHYNRHKFNWVPQSNIPACDEVATWYGPNSVRRGKYPYEIKIPPVPPEDECCQDDWFYCPSVQDAPCSTPVGAASLGAQAVHESATNTGNKLASIPLGLRDWNMRI